MAGSSRPCRERAEALEFGKDLERVSMEFGRNLGGSLRPLSPRLGLGIWMDFGRSLRGIWKGFGGSSRPCRERAEALELGRDLERVSMEFGRNLGGV